MLKKLLFLSALFYFMLISTSTRAQILFTEDFASGTLPVGWTNDSLGMPAMHLWVFNNPFTRVITGAGFDANFALFDSDESLTNDSIFELATLSTPLIDITGAGTILFLELDEQFRYLSGTNGEAKRTIEYSIDAGLSWDTLVYDSLDYGYPNPAQHSSYDISSVLGSATDLMVRFTYTGDYDWWWALDNVQVTSYSTCTTPPNAGTATSSVPNTCPDDLFDLILVGSDVGPDLTYQWQSSPDNSTWTDITGATSLTYSLSQTTATYYQCIVTCTGVDATSSSVQVSMSAGNTCYCTPPGYGCVGITGVITNVTITGTTLNNNSTCDELTDVAYTFWPITPTTTAILARGAAYDFSVTTDDDNIISIWIDYDLNGGFDPSEWVQVCTTSDSAVANTINILIPATATMGPTRMRVRARLVTNVNDSTSSCLLFGSGESEDYLVGLDFNAGVNQIPLKGTSMFPNPSTGITYVFFENTIANAKLSVYNHLGKLVQTHEVQNTFSTQLDLSAESNGIYFIRIESSEGNITQKLILNK